MQSEPHHRRKNHVVKSGVKKPATVRVKALTPKTVVLNGIHVESLINTNPLRNSQRT